MIRLPPRSTRTYTLFPDTTLFRSRPRTVAPEQEQTFRSECIDLVAGKGKGPVGNGEQAILRGVILREIRLQPLDEIFHLRSEEHTSELQSLMRISYAVFCLKKKKKNKHNKHNIY